MNSTWNMEILDSLWDATMLSYFKQANVSVLNQWPFASGKEETADSLSFHSEGSEAKQCLPQHQWWQPPSCAGSPSWSKRGTTPLPVIEMFAIFNMCWLFYSFIHFLKNYVISIYLQCFSLRAVCGIYLVFHNSSEHWNCSTQSHLRPLTPRTSGSN